MINFFDQITLEKINNELHRAFAYITHPDNPAARGRVLDLMKAEDVAEAMRPQIVITVDGDGVVHYYYDMQPILSVYPPRVTLTNADNDCARYHISFEIDRLYKPNVGE